MPRRFLRAPAMLVHISIALLTLLIVAVVWGYSFIVALVETSPVLERGRLHLEENIQILDRDGGLLYQFTGDENRLFLPTESIPERVKQAFIAIEDERFLTRDPCIDIRSVLRALWRNLTTDRIEGASTITQQLTRTLYLTREKTLKRKFYEVILSCRLERILSKDEILTLYINSAAFGNGIFGIEQASKTYFGISAPDLTLPQIAALAAIPQRPTFYSPYGPNLKSTADRVLLQRLKTEGGLSVREEEISIGLLPRVISSTNSGVVLPGRSTFVLEAMERLGFVSTEEKRDALSALPGLTFRSLRHPIEAPHFALWIRAEIESLLLAVGDPQRWRAAGLRIQTTLDPELQFIAEDVLINAKGLLLKYGVNNAALVALDRETRQVVAYVGNTDFFDGGSESQIDMARVPRQPGSSFKPLIYAAAFERGYTPDSRIRDEPIRIGTDQPKNFDGGFLGWMTVRDAIGKSRNIPAIKAFIDAGGEDRILDLGARMGIVTPKKLLEEKRATDAFFSFGWPMAIGSAEVPLIEMVQMYATLAERGVFSPLKYLCAVSDRVGQATVPLFQVPATQAVSADAADGIVSILEDIESKPEGYWRNILTIPGMTLGAKTGTSNLCFQRDEYGNCLEYGVGNVWTLGFSDKLVLGVWAGNADGTALAPLADGLTVAAPIWREFFLRANDSYELSEGC